MAASSSSISLNLNSYHFKKSNEDSNVVFNNHIPNIVHEIVSYLTTTEILHYSRVCKELHRIIDPLTWEVYLRARISKPIISFPINPYRQLSDNRPTNLSYLQFEQVISSYIRAAFPSHASYDCLKKNLPGPLASQITYFADCMEQDCALEQFIISHHDVCVPYLSQFAKRNYLSGISAIIDGIAIVRFQECWDMFRLDVAPEGMRASPFIHQFNDTVRSMHTYLFHIRAALIEAAAAPPSVSAHIFETLWEELGRAINPFEQRDPDALRFIQLKKNDLFCRIFWELLKANRLDILPVILRHFLALRDSGDSESHILYQRTERFIINKIVSKLNCKVMTLFLQILKKEFNVKERLLLGVLNGLLTKASVFPNLQLASGFVKVLKLAVIEHKFDTSLLVASTLDKPLINKERLDCFVRYARSKSDRTTYKLLRLIEREQTLMRKLHVEDPFSALR